MEMNEKRGRLEMAYDAIWDRPREECGVFGVYDPQAAIAETIYYGLFALQHRGQEGAGMTYTDGTRMVTESGTGLVMDVFPQLPADTTRLGIGHVLYASPDVVPADSVQPIQGRTGIGEISVAVNGAIVNADILRERLIADGAIFRTPTDAEIVLHLLARAAGEDMTERLKAALVELDGAYSMVVMTADALYGVRDPQAYRPLCVGRTATGGWVIASETCALDAIGATHIHDVRAGEMVRIDADGPVYLPFTTPATGRKLARSVFEYVYFARPDSVIDGLSVYEARLRMGDILWQECGFTGDIVMSVPDSGTVAAIGYARASGIPYTEGFVKNRYMGRTFIQPTQAMRERSVRMKLNPVAQNIRGKRLIVVDDSIVRGTTSKIIVRLLREAGAAEVNMVITSPPVKYPSYFGTDFSQHETLIAATHSTDEICAAIGADRLHFLSQDGLAQALREVPTEEISFACFDGEYRTPLPKEEHI